MLLQNNSQIDAAELERLVRHVAVERYRATPLLRDSIASVNPSMARETGIELRHGWRAFIKRIPVLGPVAVNLYRLQLNMRMPGLSRRQKLKLVPVLGPLAVWAHGLLKLTGIRAQLMHDIAVLQQQQATLQRDLRELNVRFGAQGGAHIEDRLQRLEASIAQVTLDGFYLALEARLGAAPLLVRAQQEIYSPYLEEVRAADARGLEVQGVEAIAQLRALPAGSLAYVTGFHVVTTMPFDSLADLLDAAQYALRPGGLAIFETPNPRGFALIARKPYAN